MFCDGLVERLLVVLRVIACAHARMRAPATLVCCGLVCSEGRGSVFTCAFCEHTHGAGTAANARRADGCGSTGRWDVSTHTHGCGQACVRACMCACLHVCVYGRVGVCGCGCLRACARDGSWQDRRVCAGCRAARTPTSSHFVCAGRAGENKWCRWSRCWADLQCSAAGHARTGRAGTWRSSGVACVPSRRASPLMRTRGPSPHSKWQAFCAPASALDFSSSGWLNTATPLPGRAQRPGAAHVHIDDAAPIHVGAAARGVAVG